MMKAGVDLISTTNLYPLSSTLARDERREGVRGEPVEVGRGDVRDGHGDYLRRVVCMQGAHLSFQLVEARGGRLGEQEELGRAVHRALPAVARLHLREYLPARGEVRADEHLGQPRRLLLTPRRQQHNYRRRIRVHSLTLRDKR